MFGNRVLFPLKPHRRWTAGLVAIVTASAALTAATPARADDASAVTGSDVQSALVTAAPAVLTQSDATPTVEGTTTDASTVDGTTVDVPRQADTGIVMTPDGASAAVSISIPNSNTAGPATTIDNGVIAYPSQDGASATAVQAVETGGVRFLTVISNAQAPTDYRFDMNLPADASLQPDGNGGFILQDGDSYTLIPSPWAKDANGQPVPVSYSLDGSTVVMHVEHSGAAYPVVADPWYSPVVNYFIKQFLPKRIVTRVIKYTDSSWYKAHGYSCIPVLDNLFFGAAQLFCAAPVS